MQEPPLKWGGSGGEQHFDGIEVDTSDYRIYNIHMKRTNLVLKEELLEEATRLLGQKTYSATVNLALEEAVRLVKIRGLRRFFGSGIWEGDLREMREDHPRTPRRK